MFNPTLYPGDKRRLTLNIIVYTKQYFLHGWTTGSWTTQPWGQSPSLRTQVFLFYLFLWNSNVFSAILWRVLIILLPCMLLWICYNNGYGLTPITKELWLCATDVATMLTSVTTYKPIQALPNEQMRWNAILQYTVFACISQDSMHRWPHTSASCHLLISIIHINPVGCLLMWSSGSTL